MPAFRAEAKAGSAAPFHTGVQPPPASMNAAVTYFVPAAAAMAPRSWRWLVST